MNIGVSLSVAQTEYGKPGRELRCITVWIVGPGPTGFDMPRMSCETTQTLYNRAYGDSLVAVNEDIRARSAYLVSKYGGGDLLVSTPYDVVSGVDLADQ